MAKVILFLFCWVVAMALNAQSWSEIIEDKTFPNGLELKGKKNVLIRNCHISNPNGHNGISLNLCVGVRIEKCFIHHIGTEELFFNNTRTIKGFSYASAELDDIHGIVTQNCRNIEIVGNEITDSFGKGISIKCRGWKNSSDILIEDNRIAYIYDDGIDFYTLPRSIEEAQAHLVMRGVTIRNNRIHDIGLGLTRLGFARHGIYLSTCDALVEGNTIYNCFFGQGVSIRTSAVVRNNKVWNCYDSCIAYWAQYGVANGNNKVIIENNECRQDFNLHFPMRHISNPEKNPGKFHQPIIVLQYPGTTDYARIGEIIVRNNKLSFHQDCEPGTPMIGGSGDIKTASAKYLISGNELEDNREQKVYFNSLPEAAGTDNNILK